MDFEKTLEPSKEGFGADPLGYSAMAWHKWGMLQTMAGFNVDISQPPSSDDLKSPVLWLSQAHALSQGAELLLKHDPNLEVLPKQTRGICHSQYCAVGLMLVGYSLEICLKAMLIMRNGIKWYTEKEKKHKHHRLEQLSEIIPDLGKKDKAILRGLTHYVYWAGRYPDPGSGREEELESVFTISEKYQVSAKDLFTLSSRIMAHAQKVADEL